MASRDVATGSLLGEGPQRPVALLPTPDGESWRRRCAVLPCSLDERGRLVMLLAASGEPPRYDMLAGWPESREEAWTAAAAREATQESMACLPRPLGHDGHDWLDAWQVGARELERRLVATPPPGIVVGGGHATAAAGAGAPPFVLFVLPLPWDPLLEFRFDARRAAPTLAPSPWLEKSRLRWWSHAEVVQQLTAGASAPSLTAWCREALLCASAAALPWAAAHLESIDCAGVE